MSLKVEHLTKNFGQTAVVKDVSFSIDKGTCCSLIGPNGAGKTTLLRMLAGLLAPDSGTISLHADPLWKSKVGYLPQVPNFYGWMTADEFLSFMGKLSKLDRLDSRIGDVLEAAGLKDARHKQIGGFSGGMKQRLGFAQALLHEPEYLFLDEPVSALDPIGRREVMDILKKLKETATIFYSTHVLHDAEEVSDEVILMKEGSVLAHGRLEELLTSAERAFRVEASGLLPDELAGCGFVKKFNRNGASSADIVLYRNGQKNELLRWCLDHNIDLVLFQEKKQTLESVFMEVID